MRRPWSVTPVAVTVAVVATTVLAPANVEGLAPTGRACKVLASPAAVEQSPSQWPETMSDDGATLLYQDCFRWQEDFLVNDLSARPTPMPPHLQAQQNEKQRARIASRCFETDLFRKVRMTYFDAGHKVQVFNSLWYPRPEFDAPLLGIDLICFSTKKMLTVVDCQPTRPADEQGRAHLCPTWFDERFKAIRHEHPGLCGSMSNRYYGDEGAHFFSDNILFGRFEDHAEVQQQVAPAFEQYATAYVEMVSQTLPRRSPTDVAQVLRQQRDYDEYFSHRDPAHGMFTRYFGEQWASEFVFDFLFEGATPPSQEAAAAVGRASTAASGSA